MDGEFAGRLSLLLRKLGDSQPARRVPGPMECAYRPIITTADWPERMPEGGLQEGITTDF